jgi:hypothetical protein
MLKAKDLFLELGATCITPLALDSANCVAWGDSQMSIEQVRSI